MLFTFDVCSFSTKALADFGLVGVREPFQNLLTQGMVLKMGLRCLSPKVRGES